MIKTFGILFICIVVIIAAVLFTFTKNRTTSLLPTTTPQQNVTLQLTPTGKITKSKGAVPAIPLQLSSGFTIHVFASGLGNPRDLQFSPGGTLLVSNPSGNQVIALPDSNHDGVADTEKVVIDGENHVHGLAFYNGKLFIADVDKVVRYNWDEHTLSATKDKDLFSLPENDDHNSRTLIFDKTGKLFVTVGSTCNVCHESSEVDATVLVSDADGNNPHVFASGLRNAPFLAVNPVTGELWVTEMGRDYLGDNIPPDEIDIARQGQNYGWPYCYGQKIHDDNFDPTHTHSCDTTTPPIFEIPSHSAPLGLAFITSSQFPTDWQGDLLVTYHGSWNRSIATGFKVVHMKVKGNTISNADDFLTGFLQGNTNDSSLGRPVDMTFDSAGNLYLSDDKAGNIYIIQKD